MTEPRTEAGKRLLLDCDDMDWLEMRERILAIEAEAAPHPLDEQADVAALRALAQKALDAHRLDIQREVEESGRRDGPDGVGCWCHGLAALLDEGETT